MKTFVIAYLDSDNWLQQFVVKANTPLEAVKSNPRVDELYNSFPEEEGEDLLITDDISCESLSEILGEFAFDQDSNFSIIEII